MTDATFPTTFLWGGATAAIFAPMMACVTGWFDNHRSLAVSLVSAGMGMAPMTMSSTMTTLRPSRPVSRSLSTRTSPDEVVLFP